MKAYMVSLGCSKNQVDTEMILGLFKNKDISVCKTPQEADILMVNTCAFIESAKEEAINTILDLASFKDGAKKMLVFGCMSQRYKKELEEQLPEVDCFISINEYANLSEIIDSLFKIKNSSEKMSHLNRIYTTPPHFRYVKISDGCLNRCAFCAIPLIRGSLVSRPINDIVNEVRMHVEANVYEINLISQDTTRYGDDLYHKLSIIDLLQELVKIDGNFKIRLLYLYPDIVTDELINFIKDNNKIMPYFDIPIQHSEDHLLLSMNRRGSREYLLNLFKKIKETIPHAIIRTTLIVGFPGETKEDVNNLIDFMKEIKFDRLGAFAYSKEENTKAYDYLNVIPNKEQNVRLGKVMKVQSEISYTLNQGKIGKIFECVIEDYEEDSFFYIGRSYAFAPDDIDGCIYIACHREHKIGDVIKVNILDADTYTLTGEEV